MAKCPICETDLEEWNSEWISDAEELFQAGCNRCGWRGSVCYISDVIIRDYRTDKDVPTDEDGLAAWREENAKYYKV